MTGSYLKSSYIDDGPSNKAVSSLGQQGRGLTLLKTPVCATILLQLLDSKGTKQRIGSETSMSIKNDNVFVSSRRALLSP